MPYIKEHKRTWSRVMCSAVHEPGSIAWLLYSYFLQKVEPSFANYSQFVGELECVKDEIYRRIKASFTPSGVYSFPFHQNLPLMMPYIKEHKRSWAWVMCQAVHEPGSIAWLLYDYFLKKVEPSFANYSQFVGELECVKDEIYRRIIVPYENEKIKENGDIAGR